jgi:GTP-binding protein
VKIKEAKYVISSPGFESCPKADRPEYAFIGRSNVGKSSLINMLCHKKNLAKISGTPGKTQLINHFEIISSLDKKNEMKWYLVDLPGYGFAKKSQSTRRRWEQMIENYLRKRENLQNVFVLIDSRVSPQEIDIDLINKLGKWQIPFTLVFTKSDKNKEGATQKNVSEFLKALKKYWNPLPEYVISSALTNRGRDEILNIINELNSN